MMFDQPPSNPIPGSSGVVQRASSSRKRSMDDSSIDVKRPRYNWYVKLASESSSLTSEDDTESIYSIQGYETERIQDTPDTDTKSEYSSSSDVDFEVEYEVDDLSGEEENPLAEGASSSGTDDVLAAAGAIAAVICDSPIEAWLTGGEDSDNSSAGDPELNHTNFWTCVQCNSLNNNPLFRYCQKCFQMRKNLFLPRPRGHRKRQRKAEKQPKEIKMSVQQKPPEHATDSGIGSQESVAGSGSSQIGLELDVPTYDLNIANTSNGIENARGVKRKSSSETNGDDSTKRSKTEEVANGRDSDDGNKQLGTRDLLTNPKEARKAAVAKQYPEYEDKSMCIMCESASQDSVFVHTGMGCLCCCYKCAKRTWTTHKKCPACTRRVNNIIKINKA